MASWIQNVSIRLVLTCCICELHAAPKAYLRAEGHGRSVVEAQPALSGDVPVPRATPEKIKADEKIDGEDAASKNRDFVLTCVIAAAAVTQALVAIWQGHIYRRQYKTMTDALEESRKSAEAANKGISALEKIERPFLLVETGGDRGTEFWVRNCGKVPARILYMRPDLSIDYPVFDYTRQDYALRQPPYYGVHYDDPRVEQINVQWIAPGSEFHFTDFSTSLFDYYGEDLKADLGSFHKVIRMYSAIKYRGLVSDEIFESRFCYGWSKDRGTYMTGSYGYNQYT